MRSSARRWPGGRRRRRSALWRRAGQRPRRRRRGDRGRRRRRAARHPHGPPGGGATARCSASVGEIDPACWSATASPSGSRGWRWTSSRWCARAAPRPAVPAGEPVPVERHRPRLRARRRGAGGHRHRRPPGGGRRAARPTSRLFDVYRGARGARGSPQPGLPAAAAGAGPHPHRRRRGRGAPALHRGRGGGRRRPCGLERPASPAATCTGRPTIRAQRIGASTIR